MDEVGTLWARVDHKLISGRGSYINTRSRGKKKKRVLEAER